MLTLTASFLPEVGKWVGNPGPTGTVDGFDGIGIGVFGRTTAACHSSYPSRGTVTSGRIVARTPPLRPGIGGAGTGNTGDAPGNV